MGAPFGAMNDDMMGAYRVSGEAFMRYVFVPAIVYVTPEPKPQHKSTLWPVMSITLGLGKRQVASERGAGFFRMHVLIRLHVLVRLSPRRDRCGLRIPGLLSG
jgi:hypothetical protein